MQNQKPKNIKNVQKINSKNWQIDKIITKKIKQKKSKNQPKAKEKKERKKEKIQLQSGKKSLKTSCLWRDETADQNQKPKSRKNCQKIGVKK